MHAADIARGIEEIRDPWRADGRSRANHACSSGALADSAKNGRPIETREQAEQPERFALGRRPAPAGGDAERQRQGRREHQGDMR